MKKKKNTEKGLNSIIKITKKDLKNWVEIDTENYLKKYLKIDTCVCMIKRDKTKRI